MRKIKPLHSLEYDLPLLPLLWCPCPCHRMSLRCYQHHCSDLQNGDTRWDEKLLLILLHLLVWEIAHSQKKYYLSSVSSVKGMFYRWSHNVQSSRTKWGAWWRMTKINLKFLLHRPTLLVQCFYIQIHALHLIVKCFIFPIHLYGSLHWSFGLLVHRSLAVLSANGPRLVPGIRLLGKKVADRLDLFIFFFTITGSRFIIAFSGSLWCLIVDIRAPSRRVSAICADSLR